MCRKKCGDLQRYRTRSMPANLLGQRFDLAAVASIELTEGIRNMLFQNIYIFSGEKK